MHLSAQPSRFLNFICWYGCVHLRPLEKSYRFNPLLTFCMFTLMFLFSLICQSPNLWEMLHSFIILLNEFPQNPTSLLVQNHSPNVHRQQGRGKIAEKSYDLRIPSRWDRSSSKLQPICLIYLVHIMPILHDSSASHPMKYACHTSLAHPQPPRLIFSKPGISKPSKLASLPHQSTSLTPKQETNLAID